MEIIKTNISWVATIEGVHGVGEIKIGIQKREDGRFDIVGKQKNGEIADCELTGDSIRIVYSSDVSFQWIERTRYPRQK
ncbi:hypothetical protein [Acetobacterium sp.]|uniref:hypothetical protein n=1 Tax=Acetobacterium sp. TaxID=1872094 RepID=UPI002F3E827E